MGIKRTELKPLAGLAIAALIASLGQLQGHDVNHVPSGYTRALRIIKSVEAVKEHLSHALDEAKKMRSV